ncbi:MAG: hypothetical protein ACYC0C_17020 [Devosia sp.]
MLMNSTLRVAFAALLSLPVMLPQVATALPNQRICRITTYYQEAALTNIVGTRTNCPGGQSSGRTSRHFEIEIVELESPRGPGGPGGAGMPCEFVADGTGPWDPQNTCQNLPIPRGKTF